MVIHSYGSGELLVQTLNAVARMFTDASDSYISPMTKFMMSTCGIWAGIYAIFSGNVASLVKHYILPLALVYIFLFVPKTHVIVRDNVTSYNQKIDNIPFIIGFSSSFFSSIAYSLASLFETQLVPANSLRMDQSGLMFGAYLVGKMRELRIDDPILLENAKQICRQCFVRPWLMGNIMGLRREAIASKDIVGFIRSNAPRNFGVYYKDAGGETSFMVCQAAANRLQIELNDHVGSYSIIGKFGIATGISTDKLELLEHRMRISMTDTIELLTSESKSVHEWMLQSMMLNANRESIDDWRESVGHGRIYPSLARLGATRGLFEQSMGYIISGQMAAQILPLMQGIIFSIIICAIFVVFPFAMIPKGMRFIGSWIKMLIWVSSWPVFFAILNAIGLQILSFRASSMGDYSGISILEQGSYSEMIMSSYSIVQFFASLVPFIAWHIVSGAASGIVDLAGRISLIGAASNIGASMVDNNISLDNIQVGSRSFAQQQMGPKLSMGSKVDTGAWSFTQDAREGSITQQQVTSGATSYSISDAYNNVLQKAYNSSLSQQKTISKRLADTKNIGSSYQDDFLRSLATGQIISEGFGLNDQKNLTNLIEQSDMLTDNVQNSESKSTATSTRVGMGAGFIAEASTGSSATNNQDLSKSLNASISDAQRKSLNKALSISREGRFSGTDDQSQRLSVNIKNNNDMQESLSKELQATKNMIDNYSNAIEERKTQGSNINENLTGVIQERIMKDFNLDSMEALKYMQDNPSIAKKHLQDLVYEKYGAVEINEDSALSIKKDIEQKDIPADNEFGDRMRSNIVESDGIYDKKREMLEQNIEMLKQEIAKQEKQIKSEQEKLDKDIDSSRKKLENEYNDLDDYTSVRAGKKGGENIKDTALDVKEVLKNMDPAIGKRIIDDESDDKDD